MLPALDLVLPSIQGTAVCHDNKVRFQSRSQDRHSAICTPHFHHEERGAPGTYEYDGALGSGSYSIAPARRGIILIRVNHGLDCKQCVQLAERYQEAVARLVNLSQRLSIVAGTHGDHQQFERLLEEIREARRECKRILTDFEQHTTSRRKQSDTTMQE